MHPRRVRVSFACPCLRQANWSSCSFACAGMPISNGVDSFKRATAGVLTSCRPNPTSATLIGDISPSIRVLDAGTSALLSASKSDMKSSKILKHYGYLPGLARCSTTYPSRVPGDPEIKDRSRPCLNEISPDSFHLVTLFGCNQCGLDHRA